MEMDWTSILTGLISAIGGLATGFFTFRNKQSDSFREDFKEVVDRLQLDIEKLQAREDNYLLKIRDLENEITLLKNKLVLTQAAQLDMPIPQWIKDTRGVMLALNTAYEEMFLSPLGKTSADYIGKRDEDVFDAETAAEFAKADKQVLRTRGMWQGVESINYGTYSEDYLVMKYPIFSNSMIIGTAGIVYRRTGDHLTSADN